MSSKKLKLIESAQKFIAKGQWDRAIKDYEQIVAIDQGDIKQRQKLAELLVRVNRKLEASAEYEIIAKHYSQGLFYLKAIAVYKQIQKLDPDNINTRFSLAALYAKQGLAGNALTEYNILADHYQKAGLSAEALKVIEQMLEVDPDNLNSRLRLAEACFDAGEHERSYREFINLALLYRKGGDEQSFARISERIPRLFPDHTDFAIEALKSQIAGGNAAGAIVHLRDMVDKDRTNLKAWELLADSYLKSGEPDERKEVLLSITEIFPDLITPLESLIQAHLDEDDIPGALELLQKHEAQFIGNGSLQSLERYYASLREKAPDNPALLQALINLYESCGENEKLASLVAAPESSLEIGVEKPDIPVTPVVHESPAIPIEQSPAKIPEPPDEMSWEEEIDLSLLDDEETGAPLADAGENRFTTSPGLPRFDGPIAADTGQGGIFDGKEVAIESEGLSEISLEIEESEIPGAKWQLDSDPMEHGDFDAEIPDHGRDGGISEFSLEGEGFADIPLESTSPAETLTGGEAEPGTGENIVETTPPGRKRKTYDLDGQFSEFKKGVDQQLDKDDTETHYNLGIAYKEMGLFDDAISEFKTASVDPQRRIDCMTFEAICYRDKGDFTSAEDSFRNTLSLDGLTAEEELSINYELAFLFETIGRKEEALKFYRQVLAINPGFRDATKKIAHLQGRDEDEETELLELDVEESDQ